MATIEEAGRTVADFLKNSLSAKDLKVIKITKVSDAWETEAEVYEENSFIKTLGLPTSVMDRNIYTVRLNDKLEVLSYERKGNA